VNIPKDSDIDDGIFEPLDYIFDNVLEEFENFNGINTILAIYQPIYNEFFEFSAQFRNKVPKYNEIYLKMCRELQRVYDIEHKVILVNINEYTTQAWGNLYWRYWHLTTILVNYAYNNNRLNDFLDLPTLIYNIDFIIPCPSCKFHYRAIKNNQLVQQTIKYIAFGMPCTGLMGFHNLITENVLKYNNRPIAAKQNTQFTMANFALEYKCIEVSKSQFKNATTYASTVIDWQPRLHVILTIIFATFCPQSYVQASRRLKSYLYPKLKNYNKLKTNTMIKVHYSERNFFTEDDLMYENLTAKQIKWCLYQAVLLQFQYTKLNNDMLKENQLFNNVTLELYLKYETIIKELIENMDRNNKTNIQPSSSSEYVVPTRQYLLNIFERLHVK